MEQKFKKLLRLNRLPHFEDLDKKQQELIQDFKEDYDNLTIFELPEKWKIRITSETLIPLGKWRTAGQKGKMRSDNRNPRGWCTSPDGFYYDPEDLSRYFYGTDLSEYTEITLEQFKKHVLNGN